MSVLDMLFATFMDTAKFIPQSGAWVQPLIFLPFPGNLVLAVLTAASAAIYMGCRPVRSGWSGVVGAFDMDIEKLILRGGARAQPPLRLALLRVGRLGTFDPSVDDVCHPGGTFQ